MTDDRWRLPDEPCLRGADSVAALAAVRFRAGVNAACWPRRLAGDFAQVVAALEARLAPRRRRRGADRRSGAGRAGAR
jgi:hypothetical protein